MESITGGRPGADEYAPFYAGYVERVPEGDIAELLERQREQTWALLAPLGRATLLARPTPKDWNILEVIGHITDAEQVFAYRAMCIARGETVPLPGFDQDEYVRGANFSERSLDELLDAYTAQRNATLALVRGIRAEAWQRRGTASGHPASARAFAYIIAGHELYHIADFRTLYGLQLYIAP